MNKSLNDIINFEVITMEEILSQILDEIKAIKAQVSKNTNLLKSLVYSSEVNKPKHNQMNHDISNVLSEIKYIRSDLNAIEL